MRGYAWQWVTPASPRRAAGDEVPHYRWGGRKQSAAGVCDVSQGAAGRGDGLGLIDIAQTINRSYLSLSGQQ